MCLLGKLGRKGGGGRWGEKGEEETADEHTVRARARCASTTAREAPASTAETQLSASITTTGFGWRIHCGVEVTELSTNEQHVSPARTASASASISASGAGARTAGARAPVLGDAAPAGEYMEV